MGFLKKIFRNVKLEKIKFNNFDSNDKNFGKQLLQYFQKVISQNIDVSVKTDWIKKVDNFPLITITKDMDEIQKLYKNKIVSFDFNIWCNDKKTRDLITNKLVNLIKKIDFGNNFSVEMNNEPLTIRIDVGTKEKKEIENKVIVNAPQILDIEEKKGIYRCQFSLTMYLKVYVDKKELKTLEDYEKRGKLFENLVLGNSSFGGDILESKDKKIVLFKPSISKVLALIRDNKILWKKEIDNIISFDLAQDGSYVIAVAQLTKKERPSGYKSGGHIYLITQEGKIKDIKIPCDGLSCSISSDCKNFGVTTMGPEWGVYYFNNQGRLLWKNKFDKRVGGIELFKNQIILYDKMHKKTRKKIIKLDKKGNKIK